MLVLDQQLHFEAESPLQEIEGGARIAIEQGWGDGGMGHARCSLSLAFICNTRNNSTNEKLIRQR